MARADRASAPPRLAVVAGTPQLVRAARDLGIATVLVFDAAGPAPDVAVQADETIPVDLSDRAALLAVLGPMHAAIPFGRVLSLTEKGLVPAAVAGDALGLPGNPLGTVHTLQDKRRMRQLLADRGLSPVRSRPVDSADDVAAFVEAVGVPAILKPSAGTGSTAVLRIGSAAEVGGAWTRFVAAGGQDAVVEEFLDGPEVSVETFSHEGRHTLVTVTDKTILPSFVESGHTVPSTLDPVQTSSAADLVRAFLDTVGLREGPAHTELKLTPDGPRIIESHNRIGGDKIRELVSRAFGIDLVRLTVGVPFGLLPALREPPVPHGGAAIRFLLPSPGTVRRITTPPLPATGEPVLELDVAVGDVVRPVRSSDDRVGYVLAEGADAAEAAERCALLRDRILIETDAGIPAGTEG
jgi:biotin carboxylase